jgi:hypothetical protein|tara:strand:+ start:261 stop:608 length:348 start_codon:yes stop_codon:yes gene_type:complete
MAAGVHNFKLKRRADFNFQLDIADGSNNPANLTGHTIKSQCWSNDSSGFREVKYADFTVTMVDIQTGKVKFSLTNEQTATFLIDKLSYDVKQIFPNGDETYLLEGVITISEGNTE